MPIRKPKWVAHGLARDFANEEFTLLSLAAANWLRSTDVEISAEVAAEEAEQNLEEILKFLHEYMFSLTEDGIEPTFEIEGDLSEAYIRAKSREANEYRKAMAVMDPIMFEDLCRRILIAMGAKQGSRTGQSGDGGVDFVARALQICSPASVGARVQIIGQAKRYAIHLTVGDREMREFVGGAIKRVADPTDKLVYRSERLAPVIYAFWTTAEFTSSALTYAKSIGLWHLNGLGLAQLAIKNNVPLVEARLPEAMEDGMVVVV